MSPAINSIVSTLARVWTTHFPKMIDQCIGRGIVAVDRRIGVQLGQDAAGKLLAELHPH